MEGAPGRSAIVLATAGYDHYIKFWDATERRCYRTIHYNETQVNRLEITPDKQYLAAAGNPHIRLYDIPSCSNMPVTTYDGHTGNVTAIGFHVDGHFMYSGSEDGTVRLWDQRAPNCLREYVSRAAVNTVVLHPNQMELISGDQHGNIRVWDLRHNHCSFELVPDPDTAIRSIAVKGDGTMVVAANNKGVCFCWRLSQGTHHPTTFEPQVRLEAHSNSQQKYILKCLFSPEYEDRVKGDPQGGDGGRRKDPSRFLATCSADGSVKIWELENKTFKLHQELRGHTRWVWDCVFSVDGAYMVTASSDTTARLWDVQTGECIREYEGHTKACVACALHDGEEQPED